MYGRVIEAPAKKSDLSIRAASAVVMVAVAGTALWLGDYAWAALVAVVALAVLYEWLMLARAIVATSLGLIVFMLIGIGYIGLAALTLAQLRWAREFGLADAGLFYVLLVVGAVIAIDVGAYFTGRTFGGPKIAPKISPSKTWSGLAGGAVSATTYVTAWYWWYGDDWQAVLKIAWIVAPLVAVIAQAGDFLESRMKRLAGVKDSGNLIPGHGGLFDRVDGLLAVCFVYGLLIALISWTGT
ncbi:MAG TPA: phosphatidate cytidylyltransferase [Novosphingobium sp.]|nr:phosphatidate cytidylyltransferase [Novosphingobium sp.]